MEITKTKGQGHIFFGVFDVKKWSLKHLHDLFDIKDKEYSSLFRVMEYCTQTHTHTRTCPDWRASVH